MSFGKVMVIRSQTIQTYGVDPEVLSENDDKQVCVRCLSCHEEFVRHFSMAYLPHDCLEIEDAGSVRTHTVSEYEDDCRERVPIRMECMLLHPLAKLPYRKRSTDAGWDVFSVEDKSFRPHVVRQIRLGLAIAAPPGFYYTIEGRSSLWSLGVMEESSDDDFAEDNGPRMMPFRGIIDGTFTGPLSVIMMNGSDSPFSIKKGERVAQIVLHEIVQCDFNVVERFSPHYSRRGEAGFGSSGR